MWYSALRINGKLVRKPLSTDRRIAEEKLAELVGQRSATKYGHGFTDISWPAFRDKYLLYCRENKKEGTYRHDRASVLALERVFRPKKPQDITPEVLGQIRSDLIHRLLSPGTINRWLRALKSMMRVAHDWGHVQEIKWRSVKALKEPRGRLIYFTPQECVTIIQQCGKTDTQHPWLWRTIILLGIRAGLRRSEIYWLSWKDVDWERNRLHIAPKDGWAPKDFERRWIPMSRDLRSHLQQIARKRTIDCREKLQKIAQKHTNYVIEIPGYGRPTLGSITTVVRRIIHESGLVGSAHTLRHTFASHLASAGVPLYTISKLLGHSTVKTTEIYAHLQPETQEDAISRLPNL